MENPSGIYVNYAMPLTFVLLKHVLNEVSDATLSKICVIHMCVNCWNKQMPWPNLLRSNRVAALYLDLIPCMRAISSSIYTSDLQPSEISSSLYMSTWAFIPWKRIASKLRLTYISVKTNFSFPSTISSSRWGGLRRCGLPTELGMTVWVISPYLLRHGRWRC